MSLTLHRKKAVYFVYETVLKWEGAGLKYMPNLQRIEMKSFGLGERAAIFSLMFLTFCG